MIGRIGRIGRIGASRLGVVAALLLAGVVLAVGCASGGKPSAASTTTVATAVPATTTTVAPPSTVAQATDDKSVQSRLRDAATAELTRYTDKLRFTADLAELAGIDPSLTFGSGLSAPVNPVVVNVAISPDAQWACLTGKSSAGHVFVVAAGPAIDVYAGTAALKGCSAAVVRGLSRINS